MDRRAFLGSVAGSLLAAPRAADTQPAPTRPKIGYLSPSSASSTALPMEPFRDALRRLGYTPGVNVTIEARFADDHYDRLPALADELVRLKVDVIVALTTLAALAAHRATTTIPIVFTWVSDPVRLGLVASLARPGANTTGFTDITTDLAPKRLGLLKEAVPGLTRVGVLQNFDNPGADIARQEFSSAARPLGLELFEADARKGGDLEPAFAAFTRARAGGVIVGADAVLVEHKVTIARLAMSHRLPLIGWSSVWPTVGALLSYGVGAGESQRQAASYVAKILNGAKPADLPVQEPTRFELVINLKTAKALGLKVPESLRQRADEVIQ